MKPSWFFSFLSRIINKRAAAAEAELAQILRELEPISTSSDPGAKEEVFAKLKDFVERHPERADEIQGFCTDKIDETHLAREKLVLDDHKVEVSHIAQDCRKQMGWPLTGSVRELDGGSPAIKFAIEEIEQHGGILTLREASRVLAALDPESPEAAFFRWEAKKWRE